VTFAQRLICISLEFATTALFVGSLVWFVRESKRDWERHKAEMKEMEREEAEADGEGWKFGGDDQ